MKNGADELKKKKKRVEMWGLSHMVVPTALCDPVQWCQPHSPDEVGHVNGLCGAGAQGPDPIAGKWYESDISQGTIYVTPCLTVGGAEPLLGHHIGVSSPIFFTKNNKQQKSASRKHLKVQMIHQKLPEHSCESWNFPNAVFACNTSEYLAAKYFPVHIQEFLHCQILLILANLVFGLPIVL